MRILLPVLLMTACTPDPEAEVLQPRAWQAPDAVGPYAVGATTHEFVDARGVELTVEIWYPALPAVGESPSDYGNLSLVRDAYRDAPLNPQGGPYPLVAFSHGFGGIRYQSTFLTEHLASHGFVVVAPDHPFNTLFDLDSDRTAAVAMARPGDITASVDEMARLATEPGPFEGAIDATRFGMVGHSFGGWTSLAVGGGVIDLDATAAHCENAPTASCDFLDLSGLPNANDARPDPRVAAMVALAPGGAYTFVQGSLTDVPSAMVIGGARDGDMPFLSEIVPAYDALGTGATLVTLARSGHWAFTDLCDLVDVFDDCRGEADGYMDAAVVQARTNTLVTAHLRATMLDSVQDVPWLEASAFDQDPDVRLEVAP